MRTLPVKELDLLGSRNSLHLMDDALELLARYQAECRSLITHRFPFEELGAAFKTLRDKPERVGKVAIDFEGASA
jgi:L-gulonate 5-dehydrogenase